MKWGNLHQKQEEKVASLLTVLTSSSYSLQHSSRDSLGRPCEGISLRETAPATPQTNASIHVEGWVCACGLTAKHCELRALRERGWP